MKGSGLHLDTDSEEREGESGLFGNKRMIVWQISVDNE